MKPGTCRFCGCTELDACVVNDGFELAGCSWIDLGRTVCSACTAAAKAETVALRTWQAAGFKDTDVQLLEALHVGFVVGWFGVTKQSSFGRNPYRVESRERKAQERDRVLVEAWDRGHLAGAEASRQHRQTCGPLENAPRKDALRVGRGVKPVRSFA